MSEVHTPSAVPRAGSGACPGVSKRAGCVRPSSLERPSLTQHRLRQCQCRPAGSCESAPVSTKQPAAADSCAAASGSPVPLFTSARCRPRCLNRPADMSSRDHSKCAHRVSVTAASALEPIPTSYVRAECKSIPHAELHWALKKTEGSKWHHHRKLLSMERFQGGCSRR